MNELLSRRKFLTSSALWSGALLSPSVFGKTSEAQIPNVALQSLRRSLTGPLVTPGDQGFNELALPNNLRYRAIRPGAIALCRSPEDIAQCLKWCSQTGVSLATRGGGHSYAGYSSTEGLMINLMNFNTATYTPQDGTITVGGGIRNGSIYSALSKVNRSITHGRCPTVAAGGFLLGGGVGFDMR
ncbi:MAG: FAD-binding protein, partial [Methylococcus sp.]